MCFNGLLSFLNMLPLSQLYSQYQLISTPEVGYCHQLPLLVFLCQSVNSKENFYCLSVCLSVHILHCFCLSSAATFKVRNLQQINGRTWKNRLGNHSDFKPLDVICASASCLRLEQTFILYMPLCFLLLSPKSHEHICYKTHLKQNSRYSCWEVHVLK